MKTGLQTILVTLVALLTSQMALAQPNGNVLVGVDNGDLYVVGNDDNDVFIYVTAQVQTGRFIFTDPVGNTTFNGVSQFTVNNINGDMKFKLGKGKNTLILDDGLAADFDVFGDLEITSNSEQQSIIIIDDADVEGRTKITTKNGRDAVFILESDVEQFVLNTGNGDDVFWAFGNTADFNSSVDIKTGKGNDGAFYDYAEFFGQYKLQLGSGDDFTTSYSTAFRGSTNINGNGGIDSFAMDFSFFAAAPVLKSIENPNSNPGTLNFLAYNNPTFVEAVDLLFTFNINF